MAEELQTAIKSKRDLYAFCPVAVRFRLEHPWLTGKYEHLFGELGSYQRGRPYDIEHFYPGNPPSTLGVLTAKSGKEVTAYIVLEHENGPELYVLASQLIEYVGSLSPTIQVVSAWVGVEIAKKLLGKSVDAGLNWVVDWIKARFKNVPDETGRDNKLLEIEIRTENKGVIQIPADQFRYEHLECVGRNFEKIQSLAELQETCFKGVPVRFLPKLPEWT
jgi:hypothetical protein